ncbi:MAG: Response regulator receiver protein [Methanomicrobiales archaeon 53_19]|jgi:CheY-like chemotaxis protein|uniref:ATP-binding response regulator n=1 Tax=Methanocalculus sp. TaxID=2004547 RepID=UPI00074709DA|nr:response regulator [Methanocalculus sp.]KUK71314.1 MAG: Response regulator receiver protein [Methanocalculus sp. 52_23]KUL04887.1 MAG: Response regulator receiver protein [Methanomicrobiales archaeon 53_19]HIJ06134.1 response regulator [Methanocalculus sp.]
MAAIQILIVEDDPMIVEMLVVMLRKLGYGVSGIATSADEAIMQAIQSTPDLVLMDIGLEGRANGIAAATIIYQFFSIPVVFCTAHSGGEIINLAKKAQPFGYITKPFNERDLFSVIEIAINNYLSTRPSGTDARKFKELLYLDAGVIFLDTSGRVLFMNPYAEHITAITHKQGFYHSVDKVINFEMASKTQKKYESLWEAIRESVVIGTGHDIIITTRKGKRKAVHLKVMVRKNNRNEIVGYILKLEENIGKSRTLNRY